ncbi:MAG: hypothetical protein DMG91_17025 [Acidobacteria bacterium]|nr:MAG: hypothetical protein DMG91_17025 [Acidobacteriota bacterium]
MIIPQNGHILSDLKSRSSRLKFVNRLINHSAMKASLPRKRFRNRRTLSAIDLPNSLQGAEIVAAAGLQQHSQHGFTRNSPQVLRKFHPRKNHKKAVAKI